MITKKKNTMQTNKEIKEILDDLFNNELNLNNNLREIVKKIYYPFDNLQDHIKYGDMFIKIEIKNKNEHI